MSSERTVHVRIEGRVQGVGYRAWAEVTALTLGLSGWARNRRDGSVELVLQGLPENVEEMLGECAHGPPEARVTVVRVIGEGVGVYKGFEVLPTI